MKIRYTAKGIVRRAILDCIENTAEEISGCIEALGAESAEALELRQFQRQLLAYARRRGFARSCRAGRVG